MRELNITDSNWRVNDKAWTLWDGTNQITGWVHDTNRDRWYYCYSDDIAKGWFKDTDDRWYYFSPYQQVSYSTQYYAGEMMTNWIKDNEKWYYLVPVSTPSMGIYKGQMLQSTTECIDGSNYTFDTTGAWKDEVGLSTEGAKFIESWEGFSPVWEDVGDRFLTIGIGTATSGTLGKKLYESGIQSCTHEQAYKWLQEECKSCYDTIEQYLAYSNIQLSQNKIDALISMAYNIGEQGLIKSSLFQNICKGVTDSDTIYSGFIAWSYCNGVVWEGLKRRRVSEYNLFMNNEYTGNN